MSRMIRSGLTIGLGAGFALGLTLAIGFCLGWLAAPQTNSSQPALDHQTAHEMLLKASSASGSDSISLATGQIDGSVEGLFVLDHTSGNLVCWVIDRRTNQGFISRFGTNVRADFGPVAQGRNPDYAMVTGSWDTAGAGVQGRPAQTVCYVADANSGAVVGYSLVWNKNAAQQGLPQQGVLLKVAEGIARDNTLIRE